MAVSAIKIPYKTYIDICPVNLSGAYTNQGLIDALIASDLIKPYKINAFETWYTSGGKRTGFCFLYDDTKQYGWAVVFHYYSSPILLDVREGNAIQVQVAQ